MFRRALTPVGCLTAVITIGAAALAASGAGATVATKKSQVVKVKLTSAGCPKKLETLAGPTTFKVTNDGADNVNEFEVLDGSRIVGEIENLAPGLSGDFSLTLKTGTYTTYCPGGDRREKGRLIVTGTAATALSAGDRSAVETYRAYLVDQAAQLETGTATVVASVQRGDVGGAKAAYAIARIPYERIEPVAETFGDLDPKIDARENDIPKSEWGGFHRIEKALWVDGTTAGMEPVAAELQENVERLVGLIPSTQLEPAQVANGAVELLNEVSTSKITGEEERYSHTDLVDFEANVQGSQSAFDAVKPLLTDAALVGTIDSRFAAVFTALAPYRQGTSFVLYTDLTENDTRALSQAIDALAEPLSKVSKQLVQARTSK